MANKGICGRAFKDGDQLHLPTIQYIICRGEDGTEVMGIEWWYYYYQGRKFTVCLDTDPQISSEDNYRKLPPEASVADIKRAQDEIANAIWRYYKDIPLTKRAPQYLPVERVITEDGYIYRLVGAYGHSIVKSSKKLEEE